ncbi:Coq4 family protein [Hyphococcus luteus]|uniref:Ubiquinone biosynthesis protein n=1 Tax=Hyphococcus luteus TaxID=2058213 RepID=A0A2S7K7Y5_9PROT|nr:Coq4 family protein [Marinicaulis flavus]PQA88624.1 ubiquinone biosynthesis protein [Marinicaulis flavus]
MMEAAEAEKPPKKEVPPEDYVWINGFPTPPSEPVRPFHAFASVLRLIRNKEDTRQVFEIVQALSGDSSKRLFKRFTDTAYGRRVVTEPVKLEEALGDRERLRAYPEGTLARRYLSFMEGENLTPEGLRAAAEEADIDYDAYPEFAELMRLFMHLQVNHDLWHVLSGYGRDALGELCNLVFTRQQTKNPGFRLIVLIGGLAVKLDDWSVPTIKALREAGRNAKKTEWILAHDVEELLALPLAEARARLNIAEPAVYNAIPADVRYGLLKPKVEQTQTEREKAARERAALQSA